LTMIKILYKKISPPKWIIKSKRFYPDLDLLIKLNEKSHSDLASLESISAEFSRIMKNLKLNGVWKWTGRNRLVQMDNLLSRHILDEQWTRLELLDLGASDGITALDTVENIQSESELPVNVTIIDSNFRLFRHRVRLGKIYFTKSYRPILIRWGPIGIDLEPAEGLEGVFFNRITTICTKHFTKVLSKMDLSQSTPINLVNPLVLHSNPIEICEGDLFEAREDWHGRFNAVRASNVLNLSYYSVEDIKQALEIIHSYLQDNGVLIVSRNLIGENSELEKGALWRKEDNRFVFISSLEQRPEIAGIIDSFCVDNGN
jgi:hypothetical protein